MFVLICTLMFTGIIEAQADIIQIHENLLRIARPESFSDLHLGSSVSVSGVCLTITAMDSETLSFDVISETWQKTKLGSLQTGTQVNLERAMRADGRFDGHMVQGHVEGTGRVETIEYKKENGAQTTLTISVPQALSPFIIPKGSIAIDGVSLTIASVTGNRCTLALIPTTLRTTTLGTVRIDDPVNIETDILVRTIVALHLHP